jgi:hypothetical protein
MAASASKTGGGTEVDDEEKIFPTPTLVIK